MIENFTPDYLEYHIFKKIDSSTFELGDHLYGFDTDFNNELLHAFNSLGKKITIYTEYLLDTSVKQHYQNLDLKFDANLMIKHNNILPVVTYAKSVSNTHVNDVRTNFLSSFNRTYHPGRVLLVLWLNELGWFDQHYCSKFFEVINLPNDTWEWSAIPDEIPYLYEKYIGEDFELGDPQRQAFVKKIIKFGEHESTPENNIRMLAKYNQQSFVNLVSETAPMNSIPFPTEKSFFPVAHKTLWVAWAPPGHHRMMFDKFGIQPYQCFDYSFDDEPDHVERLGKLTQMLSKFSRMTSNDWQAVYNQEKQTIDNNFEHIASGRLIQQLRQLNQRV